MSERATGRALLAIAFAGDEAIDDLTADLGRLVADSIRRHSVEMPDGTARISAAGYRRIRRDLDRAITALYGDRPNTTSPMYAAIAAASVRAYQSEVGRQVGDVRRALRREPGLLAVLDPPTDGTD